jgi:hypothetical protein
VEEMEIDERISTLMTEIEATKLEVQRLLLDIKIFIAEAQLAEVTARPVVA